MSDVVSVSSLTKEGRDAGRYFLNNTADRAWKQWMLNLLETCDHLERELADEREYATEGWDWLAEALDALHVKDVFEMRAKYQNPSKAGQE